MTRLTSDKGPWKMLEIGHPAFKATHNFTPDVVGFREDFGVRTVLAISGGADDASQANTERLIETILVPLQNRHLNPKGRSPFAILSGGTPWGVPQIVTQTAKKMGFTTIGVFPLIAKKDGRMVPMLPLLDLSVCVHPFVGESQWGDESPIYAKMLDNVIVIGGNAGTATELGHILKINEKAKVLKHVIPISGTGGAADTLSSFPGKPSVMAACIPHRPITTGNGVYAYLRCVLPQEVFNPT